MKKHRTVNVWAVIPARLGSKRLPKKNIRRLCGKPLIAYAIEAALGSKILKKVIVSTESRKIAAIARNAGVDVPELRPQHLARDHVSAIEPTLHAVRTCHDKDWVLLLQPTSPLRTSAHIDKLIRLTWARRRQAAVSVCKSQNLKKTGNLVPREKYLPEGLQLNGALYFSQINQLRKNRSFLVPGTMYFKMSQRDSVDIDTKKDWDTARRILRHG